MKALICIHGLLSNKNDYLYLKQVLAPYYDRIVTMDTPGHGNNRIDFSTENIKAFYLDVYDRLALDYETIDVIGYSLGGVIACYLQTVRKINKLILLAPAYKYLNFKNYQRPVKKQEPVEKKSSNHSLSKIFPKIQNVGYLIRFTKIVAELSNYINIIYPPTLIIWGMDDYLVKEDSGIQLYHKVRNKDRRYFIFPKINHFNIVFSKDVATYIVDFIV